MDFYNEAQNPGRLPEPVTLFGPEDGAIIDANGALFSCEESENAIGYQLLFGSEPYRVMDYMIVSDTPVPPSEVITSFPYEQTWWTVQVYDAFGSTIYADPVCVYPEKVEAPEPGLIAHWALDETEGDIAQDSARSNDGFVIGGPIWQPGNGIVDGVLKLDGIDDYVSTPFVLNPADGKFSVFIWIKGGAPGQAVLSQIGGARWLCADPSEGNLMTELKGTGRDATTELLSQTIITDGNWHRIGLVWDGSHRTLYVDEVAVAEDTQTDLEGSNNGLYIGTGKAMQAGTFWSGLIDDVRIYNRAVTP
jgi:hypothetical protein